MIGLLGLYIAISDPTERALGIIIASFFSLGLAHWFFSPYEIVFEEAIFLKRRLLKDKRIEYGEVTSIGIWRFASHRGGFRWSGLKNGPEFARILDELIESGQISEHQLDDRVTLGESAEIYAVIAWLTITATLGLLLWTGIIPTSWISEYPDWVIELVAPLTILGIAYLFFRFVWFGARMRQEKRKRS